MRYVGWQYLIEILGCDGYVGVDGRCSRYDYGFPKDKYSQDDPDLRLYYFRLLHHPNERWSYTYPNQTRHWKVLTDPLDINMYELLGDDFEQRKHGAGNRSRVMSFSI